MIPKDSDTSLIETSVIDEDSLSLQSKQSSSIPSQQSTPVIASSLTEKLSSPPRSLSAPLLLSEKKKISSDSLYSKRGITKKSRIDDAVQAIRDIAQQDACLHPEPDSFELFGSFVASRLRGMNPEECQRREMLIFKALTEPLN